ncbi:MAG: hypothetical protein RLZZ553_838 [Verrucomicrobiota bacterium]|jgi:hypothetical protein
MNEEQQNQKPTMAMNQLQPSTRKDLMTRGYMDHSGNPIGAGIHLIPVLVETLNTVRTMMNYSSAMMVDDEDRAQEFDIQAIFQSFHFKLSTTMEALSHDGYRNPIELYADVLLPHMDWAFCMQYCGWMARQMPIDLLSKDINVFEEDHPEEGFQIIRLFREVAQEKNAAWALRVADKAIKVIGQFMD